jgi:hypothetical protein
MKRLTAVVATATATLVVGTTIALAPIASSSEAPPEVTTTSASASEAAYEQLVADAVRRNDAGATNEDIDRIIAALGDIGTIIGGVDPGDVSRVVQGITQASAAVAEFQATGNPDAARRVICGSGNAAAGSLSILSDVVRLYEASANLPQIAEVLNLLDPRTPEGAALFEKLPDVMRTPEAKAALISLSDVGRALNTIDKQQVIGLAKDWAEAAAKCDVSSLLALPTLMVRTYEMGKQIIGVLAQANPTAMAEVLT